MADIENEKNKENQKPAENTADSNQKIKTRSGSGYLKQLYSTARTTTANTSNHLSKLTTFLVNFIPTDKVDASELQVRTHFDDAEIQALSHSIKEHGVLQPILVVQDGDRYKVIAGERRLRASKLAGIERIPARVLSTDDKATHEIALRENLDRVDLHPLEEGEGYVSLLEAQIYTSHEGIAKAFGKPKSRITECIGFTRLPETTKQELQKHGLKNRSLLRQLLVTTPERHLEMIREAVGKEEILAGGEPASASQGPGSLEATAEGTAQPDPAGPRPTAKKEAKPFEYVANAKGLSVPGFKWKAGEGRDRLVQYGDALKRVLMEIERRLEGPAP